MLSPAATLYLSLRALVPIVGVQEPTTARSLQREASARGAFLSDSWA